MATFHTAALNHQGKLTKSRARTSVKPILKKLHSSSHSEKNSLDLDRAWEDQHSSYAPDLDAALAPAASGPITVLPGKQSLDSQHRPYPYNNYNYNHNYSYHYFTPTQPPPQRDVSFDLSTTTTAATTPPTSSAAAISHTPTNSTTTTTATTATVTSHNRSTSGASHISVATSTASGGRNGSFVHPFQQTPRTSTPPLLSYTTSLASLGGEGNNSSSRDYSPTITEDDDNLDDSFPLPQPGARPLQSTLPHATSSYRRPSLGSQRTSSLSETQPSSLRISTRASQPVTVVADSPIALASTTPQAATASPMSPLRNSLDMNNFRIRSRSDVDTATRQEQVRVARRKFEEKERVKEEKYARAEVRKRETREARAAHSRKSSFGTAGRKSSSDVARRPEATRKSTSHSQSEKATSPGLGISGHDMFTSTSNGAYEDITGTGEPAQQPAERGADDVHFVPNHRSGKTTKRKTQGTWTAFMLWFRTRLLKLGRR